MLGDTIFIFFLFCDMYFFLRLLPYTKMSYIDPELQTYTNEKKDRDHDLKSMRKEVLRKADQSKGKKVRFI